MDIEDLQKKNKEVSEVSGSSKIDRNDLLPRDLVPEKILPFLTTFIYELFQSLYLEKDLLEWSHQQFRRFCEKSVIVFRRLHHIQPSHSQITMFIVNY